MVDLEVTLGRIRLANPILVASGTFGYIREMAGFIRLPRLGGVIPKTVTRRPRAGNPTPRTAETASGLLNAIGLDNDGIDHFLDHHLPYLRTVGTAIVANIAGESEDQFVEMAAQLNDHPGIAAVELNISCPNVSHGLDLGIDPVAVGRLVERVRRVGPLPVIAKLTPNVTDIVAIARAARDGGADAVSLVNTFRGMAVDWRRRKPILANDIGGLSGPAIKPLALRMVWEVSRALPDLPIIGIGGIATADDALEFIVAGASAVQVGTATFSDPVAAEMILDDLTRKLEAEGVDRLAAIVGTLRSNRGEPAAAPSITQFAEQATTIVENAAQRRGRTSNPTILNALQPKLVELSRLIYPDSRLVADPDKLEDHGAFDWDLYQPIWVESDGHHFWLTNGVTRVENAMRSGIAKLPAYVFPRES